MIKLKHNDLNKVVKFLLKINLKGKKNIHRMRIVKALKEQSQKVSEDEVELLKEYVETDENGELERSEKGLKFKEGCSAKDFNQEQKALYDEYFTIDDKNLESALNTVEKAVDIYAEKHELSDEDAEAHFILFEAFDQADEQSEGGEE